MFRNNYQIVHNVDLYNIPEDFNSVKTVWTSQNNLCVATNQYYPYLA